MGFFGPSLSIPRDEVEWQLATFGWLARAFPAFASRPLVTPTNRFFPVTDTRGHDRARELFDATRRAAGLEDWPCDLREGQRSRPSLVGETSLLRHDREPPAGTFHWERGVTEPCAVISYNPDAVARPMDLVATFAHELGHLLLSATREPPPGGRDLEELATDIATVYLGFGIFQANSAQSFGQYHEAGVQGWSMSRQGYLSEPALLVALAIFEGSRVSGGAAATSHLKPALARAYPRTVRALGGRYPDLTAAIHASDPAAFG